MIIYQCEKAVRNERIHFDGVGNGVQAFLL